MTAKSIRNRFHAEYFQARKAIPNRDVEAVYVQRAKEGDRAAFNTLVYKYIPFLYKMANQRKEQSYNLSSDEMVNASIVGLRKAVAAFDPTRGTSFFTLVSYKALNEMNKAAYGSLLVKRPENQLKAKDKSKIPSVAMLSLDRKDDKQMSLMDMMASDIQSDDEALRRETVNVAQQFMSLLMPQEHEVIKRLYMYDDDITLRTVGNEMRLSHERIRQLKSSALRRMQSSDRVADLIGFQPYKTGEAV